MMNKKFRSAWLLAGLIATSTYGIFSPIGAIVALAAKNEVTTSPTSSAGPLYLTATEPQPADSSGAPAAPGTDLYNFGTRNAVSSAPIEHLFLLRNGTAKAVTVERVQPSCSCTTAFAGDAPGQAPPTVAPGGWLPVHVSVDPNQLAAGPINKSTWVFLKGQATPAATLMVTGTLTSDSPAAPATAPVPPPAVSAVSPAPNTPAATVPTTMPLHLTVLSDPDPSQPNTGTAHYDFGQANALTGARIEHTFTLRNDNATPVRLDHLQPSCGCTSAVVGATAAAPGATPPPVSSVTVAPHESIQVHIAIDPAHLSPGAVEKYVWVYAQGQSDAAAILRTTGTLDAGVGFSPAVLDFGHVTAGNTPAQRLTMTLDILSPRYYT